MRLYECTKACSTQVVFLLLVSFGERLGICSIHLKLECGYLAPQITFYSINIFYKSCLCALLSLNHTPVLHDFIAASILNIITVVKHCKSFHIKVTLLFGFAVGSSHPTHTKSHKQPPWGSRDLQTG